MTHDASIARQVWVSENVLCCLSDLFDQRCIVHWVLLRRAREGLLESFRIENPCALVSLLYDKRLCRALCKVVLSSTVIRCGMCQTRGNQVYLIGDLFEVGDVVLVSMW